ncbi:hypothetical protein KUTeg_017113 [Tegillarca granosa]|uniref:Uncharacterized protein n=1 Tax=Tegillarca granosa TaxID=220873 RepID=A0ABQ9ETE1_TEGGR|nr:hypothetical protein KUTeg_017113 [Tegillarca granosa]
MEYQASDQFSVGPFKMPLSKRKRKYIAHETHEVDNSGKCKQQKTLRKFVLAKLPGTPKALKWPVSIEDCSSDEIIVYCRCDDHK